MLSSPPTSRPPQLPQLSFSTELIEHSSSPPVTLIALGKSGEGKSSLLNNVLGRSAFVAKPSVQAVTKFVQTSEGDWLGHQEEHGQHVMAVDTPSFSGGELHGSRQRQLEVAKLLELTEEQGGVDAFLITVKATRIRFDATILDTLRTLEAIFTKQFWPHAILVVTFVQQPFAEGKNSANADSGDTLTAPRPQLGRNFSWSSIYSTATEDSVASSWHNPSAISGVGDESLVNRFELVRKEIAASFQLDEPPPVVLTSFDSFPELGADGLLECVRRIGDINEYSGAGRKFIHQDYRRWLESGGTAQSYVDKKVMRELSRRGERIPSKCNIL